MTKVSWVLQWVLATLDRHVKIPLLLFLVILSAMWHSHKPANRNIWSRINLEKKKMTCQNPLTKNTMAVEAGSAFPAVSYHRLCWSLCICWSLVSVRIFAEVWVVVVEPVGTLRLEGWENPVDTKEGSDESLPVTAGFNLKIGKSSWAVLCYTKGKTKKNRWRHF